jgi:hypothetical protein
VKVEKIPLLEGRKIVMFLPFKGEVRKGMGICLASLVTFDVKALTSSHHRA